MGSCRFATIIFVLVVNFWSVLIQLLRPLSRPTFFKSQEPNTYLFALTVVNSVFLMFTGQAAQAR